MGVTRGIETGLAVERERAAAERGVGEDESETDNSEFFPFEFQPVG